MKSAIYNYTLDTLAAKEIEQAIYEGTVKIRVLPIKPSEPRGSCDDTYKLMLDQHVICTETTETKCLAQAMEIVSNNYFEEMDTLRENTEDLHETFYPTVFIIDISELPLYHQRGYLSLAERPALANFGDSVESIKSNITSYIQEHYSTATSVVCAIDINNEIALIKPHNSTNQVPYTVDYEYGVSGAFPSLVYSGELFSYCKNALRFQILERVREVVGEEINENNVKITTY
jgi:hypothetical protein